MFKTAVVLGGEGLPPTSDRAAVAWALRWADGPVAAYSFDRSVSAIAWAKAAGVDKTFQVSSPADIHFDSEFGVVFIGVGAAMRMGDRLGAELAHRCGAALVFDAIDVQPNDDNLDVICDLGRGATELLSVSRPAVICVADTVSCAQYVSRYRWQRAIAAVAKSDALFEVDDDTARWQRVTPRAKRGNDAAHLAAAESRMDAAFGLDGSTATQTALIHGDAATCAQHLLRYLSHHGFVDKPLAKISPMVDSPVAVPPLSKAHVDRQSINQPITVRLARYPQLLNGPPLAVARSPRLVALPARATGAQARGPRPVDDQPPTPRGPQGRRGPFSFPTPEVRN